MSFDHVTQVLRSALEDVNPLRLRGRVVQVAGTVVRAIAPQARVGELCLLRNLGENQVLPAEVVGFEGNVALLTPMGDTLRVSATTAVEVTGRLHEVAVGPELCGQVLDGLGRPLTPNAAAPRGPRYPVNADPPSPLSRRPIQTPLVTGVKALDAFLTCGEGQRMGILAAAGVGKTSLLGMLTKNADVDITVAALVGERGREVREFIEHVLGPQGMARSVLVVATSDRPAIERVKAAHVATAIAEYFRDQGQKVLLLMDSITRYARAQREIGLAAGEAPTRRGFPPSVFAALPRLMERAGQGVHGSITAFYTVLVEGDDMTEPVADEARSILDGHIVLSRTLAAANQFPAIDVLNSLSRVMSAVVSPSHRAAAARVRDLLAKHQELELLVRVGEYKRGEDALADEALDKFEAVRRLIRQDLHSAASFGTTLRELERLATP